MAMLCVQHLDFLCFKGSRSRTCGSDGLKNVTLFCYVEKCFFHFTIAKRYAIDCSVMCFDTYT